MCFGHVFGKMMEVLWMYVGLIMEMFWTCFGCVLDLFVGRVLDVFWTRVGSVSEGLLDVFSKCLPPSERSLD